VPANVKQIDRQSRVSHLLRRRVDADDGRRRGSTPVIRDPSPISTTTCNIPTIRHYMRQPSVYSRHG
jgi:hypothetical protein